MGVNLKSRCKMYLSVLMPDRPYSCGGSWVCAISCWPISLAAILATFCNLLGWKSPAELNVNSCHVICGALQTHQETKIHCKCGGGVITFGFGKLLSCYRLSVSVRVQSWPEGAAVSSSSRKFCFCSLIPTDWAEIDLRLGREGKVM